MVIYYNKWENNNEIQLTKENEPKYSKNDKSSTLTRNKTLIKNKIYLKCSLHYYRTD